MLYTPFENYQEFKELFGMQQHGESKDRKNKILLSYVKTAAIMKEAVKTTNEPMLRDITSMAALKHYVLSRIQNNESGCIYKCRLINYTFYSNTYSTDEKEGACYDGDINAIRYIKHDGDSTRTYKMKAGRFLKALILEQPFGQRLPEQVLLWLCEEFTQQWQAYSASVLPGNKLFVNKEFERIYDRHAYADEKSMGSCMENRGHHLWYKDSVDSSAAYLENDNGEIIARCVIFHNVKDDDSGRIYNLASRQYSVDGDVQKRTLIDALVKGGYIDCYTVVGASCHDANSIVNIDGTSMSDCRLSIPCSADYDSVLSYQDTFKWLNTSKERAYNYEPLSWDYGLDSTDYTVGGDEDNDDPDEYDSYHDTYVWNVVTVFVNGERQTCDEDDLGDFIYIDDAYHHEDDVTTCPICGKQFLIDKGSTSRIDSDNIYCTEECRDKADLAYARENFTLCDYDQNWYQYAESLITYMRYDLETAGYIENTISRLDAKRLLNTGELYVFGGRIYGRMPVVIPIINNSISSRI